MNNVEKFVELGRMPSVKEMKNLSGIEVREIESKLQKIWMKEIVKHEKEFYEKTGLTIDIS